MVTLVPATMVTLVPFTMVTLVPVVARMLDGSLDEDPALSRVRLQLVVQARSQHAKKDRQGARLSSRAWLDKGSARSSSEDAASSAKFSAILAKGQALDVFWTGMPVCARGGNPTDLCAMES
eukprot:331298-Chlamydomonas_euryale.AAC.3